MESRQVSYLLEDVMQEQYDYGFYEEDLWKYVKDKEVREYDIKDVKHWIYSPCWSYKVQDTEVFISIYQVITQMDKFPAHVERIKNAHTQYPLIVIEDRFDKQGTILDGNHRFAKLLLEQPNEKLKVHYINKAELLLSGLYRRIDSEATVLTQ